MTAIGLVTTLYNPLALQLLPPLSEPPMVGVNFSIPRWLQILLGEKFFTPCLVHESVKKNEKKIFCLDCCISICVHCFHSHRPHRLLQIRRYVYHDVIRLGDAQKLMNCSFVQPYTTNSEKVVFLHKRAMRTRPLKKSSSSNLCMKCHRSLQDSYLFCSVSCKIHHLLTSKNRINKEINNSLASLFDKARSLSLSDAGRGQMTSDHESPVSERTWSSDASGDSVVNCKTLACATSVNAESVKKKKRSVVSAPEASSRQRCSTINRRKSVPRRAPLN
ncbi:putative PLATZ transcription factor family protein [Melia azedarach]|uniref:PLATZ transcription factor family protein n=1 Tax=Melia azedarach TaxID=155640 RepID=A0ACC1XRA0_MELAZ|nr:putative PLATZ transcription factor family protein [Melia azedarach]